MMKKFDRFIAFFTIITIVCSGIYIGEKQEVKAATQNESESNDTYATADTITLGNTLSGIINDGNDEDYYKITANTNGKISITFHHTYENISDSFKVQIYKYTGGKYEEISYDYIYLNSDEDTQLPFIGATTGGVYYIKVFGYYVSGRSYSLKTSFTSSNYYEKEVNDSYNTATEMSLGQTYGGVVNSGDDEDFYKITANANGKIGLTFHHTYESISDSFKVGIYKYTDGKYEEISFEYIYLNGDENIELPYIGAVSGGVYYIRVYGYYVSGRAYSLITSFTNSNYYEKEVNDSYDTATNILSGQAYGGIINSSDDEDYYKLIANSNGEISISFSHTYENRSDSFKVVIYKYTGENHEEISYDYIYLNSDEKKNYQISAVQGNVYFIKVFGSYVVGKKYAIQIQSGIEDETTKSGIEYPTANEPTSSEGDHSEKIKSDFFRLGIDTNNFVHIGVPTYTINDSNLKSKLYNSSLLTWDGTIMLYMNLNSKYDGENKGICHGIATSMCYGNQGYLNLGSISSGAQNYWQLGDYRFNTYFKDVLVYYQLLQYSTEAEATKSIDKEGWHILSLDKRMKSFLNSFVEEAQKGQREQKPFVFTFFENVNGKNEGHSVVVCGYEWDDYNKCHKLIIYDENSFSEGKGNYTTMYVPEDCTSFDFADANASNNGYKIQDVWTSLKYYGIEKIYKSKYILKSNAMVKKANINSLDVSKHTTVQITAGKKFRLENGLGEWLSYDGENYSGTMSVYDCYSKGEGNLIFWNIEVDESNQYILKNADEGCQLIVTIEGKGYSVYSKDAESIVIDSQEIVARGEKYNIDVFVQSDTYDALQFHSDVKGELVIRNTDDKLQIVPAKECENASAYVLDDTNIQEVKVEKHEDGEIIITPNEEKTNTDIEEIITSEKVISEDLTTNNEIRTISGNSTTKQGEIKTSKQITTINNTTKADVVRNKKVKVKKVVAKRKSLKIVWKKVKGIKGYQIQYSLSKRFKKAKTITITKAKITSRTLKKLKTKKKYYVRVRAFVKSDGKNVYSLWSKAKSKKTK